GMSFDDAVKALKGMDLDTAVNALIGSMVKNGYIDEIKNSILITVNSKNAEKGIQLQQHLSEEIEGFLNNYSVKGAILSQTAKADARQKKLANQYRISTGKASLIDWLVKQDPTIQYADVADLSINDINLLIRARNTKMEGMNFRGEASTKGYIGEEKARQIAFEHAGVLKTEVQKLEVELDFEDGRMVYEVEFYHNDKEYDYEIDAKNGNILEFKVKNRHGPDGSTPTTTPGNQYIGAVEAKEIALRHAGYEVGLVNRLRTEFEDENGRMIYEVEFEHGNFKYEYEIDAVTGEILQSEVEKLEAGNNGEGNPETSADPEANYIGDGKAEEIALQHATLKRNSVRNLKVEREREQDRVIYEIQFEHGNYKYEYEIDALTGKIVQWEKEQN
ncbi:MAG TPA: PepSY domain-containing protein, partial [Bacillota bacterium]|nr:PepSY domain-containing protein [Bacillota bacterium]